MAEIDASIPLSVKPFQMPDQLDAYGKAMTLQNLGQESQMKSMQLQQLKSHLLGEQTLAKLYQDPSMMTSEGGMPALNQQGQNKLMAADPSTGMDYAKHLMEVKQKVAQMSTEQLQGAKVKAELTGQEAMGVMNTYKTTLQQTKNPQQAMQAATQARNQATQDMVQKGVLTPEQAQQMTAQPFNPQEWQQKMMQGQDYWKMISAEHENRMADIAQQHLGLESQGMGERARHDKAMETAAQGVGFEGKPSELLASLASQGVSLPAGFRSKQQQVALLNGLINKYPDLTPDQIAQKVKSGQVDMKVAVKEGQSVGAITGKVTYAEEGIKQLIPLVQQASAALPRGQFVPLNKLMQMGEESISSPELRALRIRINSLLNDYDVLAGRGGTDMAKREEVRKLLLSADSPEVLKSALDSFQKEADAAGRAASAAKKKVIGMDEQDQSSQESAPDNVTIDYTK